jgi:hypothetical protein
MEFRQKVFGECLDLKMMSDLADADQHRFLTRTRPVARAVTSSTATYSIRDNELWVNRYEKPFLPAARAAVDFWEKWPD